jgi:phosphatidylserine/phosphatidylglycerophosphate/cardiolipin synthase-like enzyme
MKESQAIHCAMYVLSDKKIAQELINAHDRGVEIHLIIDQYSWDSSFGKGRFLKANGVSFLVYAPDNHDYLKALMHAKIFVFKSLGLAWSGSYNCTQSASVRNFELVTVTDEKNVLESFLEFYHLLLAQQDMKPIEPAKGL